MRTKTRVAVAGKVEKGFITHILPERLRTLLVPPVLCASAIISFYTSFKTVLMDGTKTETRRLWSDSTPIAESYLNRMQLAHARGLFVRAWCGGQGDQEGVLIGYIRLLKLTQAPLSAIQKQNVAKEGYTTLSVKGFLEKHFKNIPRKTKVWVVEFVLMPIIHADAGTA